MDARGGMRVLSLSPVDANLPGFNVCIHCTYDITGNDAMYPHSNVTSFPDQQCTAENVEQVSWTNKKKRVIVKPASYILLFNSNVGYGFALYDVWVDDVASIDAFLEW